MSSRAYPSVRRAAIVDKEVKRSLPDEGLRNRKVVCRRCHFVMIDWEPASPNGEFWHVLRRGDVQRRPCANTGLCFDARSSEVEPFLRKKRRRDLKRRGIRP